MHELRKPHLLPACLAALALAIAVASPAAAKSKPERTPLSVADKQLHSITVAPLILRLTGATKITQDSGSTRVALLEELRRDGYPALGADNVVFGQDKSDSARFVLGGTVKELKCVRPPVRLTATNLLPDCSIGIRWELLDRESDTVVYEAFVRHAEIDNGEANAENHLDGPLILGALRSLLARPAFVKAVAVDEGSATTSSANPSLLGFKRCDSAPAPMPKQSDRVLDATVLVEAGGKRGSGFLISTDGLLLTAAHVVEGDSATVQMRDGTSGKATVLRRRADKDVALLALDGATKHCLPLAQEELSAGAEVYAIGAPASKDLAFSLTRGIVSSMRELNGARYLQTDASINPGNSGGPMVGADGKAAAVVSWKLAGVAVEGIAFGVPVSVALTSLGLQPAAQTELQLLRERPAVTAGSSEKRFVDAEDPVVALNANWQRQEEEQKQEQAEASAEVGRVSARPAWVTSARRWGFVGMVAGTITLGLALTAPDDMDVDSYKVIGWGLVGVSATALVVSYVFEPSSPNSQKTASRLPGESPSVPETTVRAGVGPGSVQLTVNY